MHPRVQLNFVLGTVISSTVILSHCFLHLFALNLDDYDVHNLCQTGPNAQLISCYDARKYTFYHLFHLYWKLSR